LACGAGAFATGGGGGAGVVVLGVAAGISGVPAAFAGVLLRTDVKSRSSSSSTGVDCFAAGALAAVLAGVGGVTSALPAAGFAAAGEMVAGPAGFPATGPFCAAGSFFLSGSSFLPKIENATWKPISPEFRSNANPARLGGHGKSARRVFYHSTARRRNAAGEGKGRMSGLISAMR
jgi:hypothetical protein